MTQTADQAAADRIGRAIDGQILQLSAEKTQLLAAPARIVEIDAQLAILQNEKTRIDPRRPPVITLPPNASPVAAEAVKRVK